MSCAELDLPTIVGCTKLIRKRLESRSWIRICQISKWVAKLTFGLRATPGLQRHLADIKCIQYAPDRRSSYYAFDEETKVPPLQRLKMDI